VGKGSKFIILCSLKILWLSAAMLKARFGLSYSGKYAAANAELRMQRWREAFVILRGEVTTLCAKYGVQD